LRNEDLENLELEGDDDEFDPAFKLIGELWGYIEEELASRKNEDYEPVPEQMEKFTQAYAFFWKMSKKRKWEIEGISLEPKLETAGITVLSYAMDFSKAELDTLSEIVGNMSALSIDAKLNGQVEFSFNIPGVFRHK